jgi:putative transposase
MPESIFQALCSTLLAGYDILPDLCASSARKVPLARKSCMGLPGPLVPGRHFLSAGGGPQRRTQPRPRPASPDARQPPARRAGRPAGPRQPSDRTRTPAHAPHTTRLQIRWGDTSTARWSTRTAGTGSVPPRNHTRPPSQIHPPANSLEHTYAYLLLTDPQRAAAGRPPRRRRGRKELRAIYTAPTAEAAFDALAAFAASPWGKKYPQAARVWEQAWDSFIPFLAFSPAVRKLLYTTNAIESLNYQLRKVTKARGHFPGDDAVVKLLWLAIINIEDKRARERAARRQATGKRSDQPARLVDGQKTTGWREALNELDTAYPGRLR